MFWISDVTGNRVYRIYLKFLLNCCQLLRVSSRLRQLFWISRTLPTRHALRHDLQNGCLEFYEILRTYETIQILLEIHGVSKASSESQICSQNDVLEIFRGSFQSCNGTYTDGTYIQAIDVALRLLIRSCDTLMESQISAQNFSGSPKMPLGIPSSNQNPWRNGWTLGIHRKYQKE